MSSELISTSELETFKTKNYRLIFCIGLSGSGLESHTEKVTNEFKYTNIIIQDIIKKEVEINSDFGQKAKEYTEKNSPLPNDLLTSILLHNILTSTSKTILINGFPNTLEQAQFFEQNICQIELILKFNATIETCIKNLIELKKSEIPKEEFQKIYDENEENFKKIIDFYSPYSIIRSIDCNQSIGKVNSLLKQNLYPIIYTIIGKRYSGKTELSKVLNAHTGIEILDFNQFIKSNKEFIKKRKDNEFIVSKFIYKLRNMRNIRILIEDFPQNKEQFIYFINNCKPFEKIYYLNADNSSCLERLNSIPLDDPNYTESSKLNEMLYEFENKKSFHDLLKQKANVMEIDVNNHLILTKKHFIQKIQPYCAYIEIENDAANSAQKEELFNKLKEKYNFYEIQIDKIIENATTRKLINKKNDELDLNEKVNLIRQLIFRENCNKILLNSFPKNLTECEFFENNLCPISKYIVFTDKQTLNSIVDENSMGLYFYKNNLLTTLNPSNSNEYKIEECLDMTRNINIVFGMPQTGKTTIAKHLKAKYNFELLDFKDLIEKIKKTKIDPENPDNEPEIAFPDLISGLKTYLNEISFNTKIIVDNIFIPNPPDPFLIDTYEKAAEIVGIFGNFKNLYEISVDENNLLNKYKTKEGITEEMNEEQKNAYEESLSKPKKLLELIHNVSANVIKVNCNESEVKTKQIFDAQFGINFIVIKHDYDICIEKSLLLFAARSKLLYINVPKLIYNHFYENDSDAKKLESFYGKKKLNVSCKNPNNFDELIYYKYNPIFFEVSLVNSLILKYISLNSKIIENNGNFVILTGYLNYDLLEKSDVAFNLPLLELKNTMELGELTAFIQLTKNEIKKIEEEKPEQLIIEKPKKKIETDPLDVDGPVGGEEAPQEEAPPEEENPDGIPKFKPENFSWTYYDGNPRNYFQILKRLKNFEVEEKEVEGNCREELIKSVSKHIEKYLKKEENKYNGGLVLIKLNGEVGEENSEELGKVIKIFEENK